MSADKWFIARDKKKLGPYTTVQMKQMAQAGQLLPIDMVIEDGTTMWMPASQAKEFFPAVGAAPPLITAAPVVPASSPPSPAAAVAMPSAVSVAPRASGKLLGVVPLQIAPPIISMVAVVLLALLASFFCGSFLVFFFSFLHNAGALACIVLTARLQKSLYALLAVLFTMTAWAWLCFTAVWTVVAILGLLAGIAVGIWAVLMFRSSNVRTLFADAGKPGPLDRFGTSILAGAASVLLVLILGIGGLWHLMSSDKNKTTYAGAGSGGKTQSGGSKSKRGPENRKPGKAYLDDLVAKMGPPSRSYAKIDDSTIAEYSLHVWDAGGGSYDLVFTALPTKTNEPEFVQGTQSDVNKTRLDAILKGYRPK